MSEENRNSNENNRKRVKQTIKRSVPVRNLDNTRYVKKGPTWIERRAFPRAESTLDAVLSAISVFLGLVSAAGFFIFFMGSWPGAPKLILACWVGILAIGAFDSWNRKRIVSYLMILGALILVFLIIKLQLKTPAAAII